MTGMLVGLLVLIWALGLGVKLYLRQKLSVIDGAMGVVAKEDGSAQIIGMLEDITRK